MKELRVKKVDASNVAAADVVALLDKNGIEFNAIDVVDWALEYPYKPDVKFRLAHSADKLLLHYVVDEQALRAVNGVDDGDIWTDSCVEFFVKFAGEDVYYNLESNCVGALLLGVGKQRNAREHAPMAITSKIERWATLGREPFGVIQEQSRWELVLIVPREVFSQSHFKNFDALEMQANFYKCGDGLPVAHFVSWNRIDAPKPDFHLPQFFGSVKCEK